MRVVGGGGRDREGMEGGRQRVGEGEIGRREGRRVKVERERERGYGSKRK